MRSANFIAVDSSVLDMIDNVCNDYVRIELMKQLETVAAQMRFNK